MTKRSWLAMSLALVLLAAMPAQAGTRATTTTKKKVTAKKQSSGSTTTTTTCRTPKGGKCR